MHSVVSDLTEGRLGAQTLVHLDPDLRADSVSRQPGWRPCFGQVSSAQGHLSRQGVGPGDVFLFFGWFRRAELYGGRWRFVRDAPNIHSLFGWLQVAEVVDLGLMSIASMPLWMHDHPHLAYANQMGTGNTLYIGVDRLFDGQHSGAGCFARWMPKLQLTAPGQSRSVWRLPAWMNPNIGKAPLSYHANPNRWRLDGDSTLLESVAKGQEFVIDIGESTPARSWLSHLIEQHA